MLDDLNADRLAPVATAALGRDVVPEEIGPWTVEQSSHVVDNMTTHELATVRGALADGTPWQAFAKVLHPASCSPIWQFIPEAHQPSVLRELDWLVEPAVYRSALADDLPDGIRLPRILAIEEAPERIVLWQEVIEDVGTWEADDYARAARALGTLAGRWPGERAAAELGLEHRDLAYLFHGKLSFVDIPILMSDEHWADPVLAEVAPASLRDGLTRMVDALPARLASLRELPDVLSHGDATPHNLLQPGDGSFVAIDWGFGATGTVGADLGQLVAGRFDRGDSDPTQLDGLAERVLDAYLEGLDAEGAEVDPAAAAEGFAVHLATRSAVSATVLDHRPDLDDAARADLLRGRIAVAQVAIDLLLGPS